MDRVIIIFNLYTPEIYMARVKYKDMRSFNIKLEEGIYVDLKKYSAETRVPMRDIIENCLINLLKKHKNS